MDQIIQFYKAIPPEVIVALLGGTFVSLFAQVIKKVFGLDSDKVIKFMVASSSFVAAGLQYLLSTHAVPPSVLGTHAAAFYAVAELFYAFIYKTLAPFLSDVSKYEARQTVAATTTPAVAETATPVTPVQNTNIADF